MKTIGSIFIVLAVFTVLFTVLVALGGGWEVLMFGLLYLGIWITHLVVHVKFASRISRWTVPSATVFPGSNLLLLGAFLPSDRRVLPRSLGLVMVIDVHDFRAGVAKPDLFQVLAIDPAFARDRARSKRGERPSPR